ncbi:MAG: FAD-dependent oxidoreductase [Desulfobacterales bacterium]|nr:FAD-dependent oxidoreductase [Desulfobacterales bacterium]
MKPKKLLVVGGVAGGASCAARARRLSEETEIIVFERGPYASFANCGLPYYVGKIIKKEEDLLVATPELFRDRFNIDVRTHQNVRQVFPGQKEIEVQRLTSGEIYRETYDALVLSPGSEPIKPNLEGIGLPGIFTLWTIPDSREIISWIESRPVKHAVVVGGGFIGLEMTESLTRLGIQTTIVEMQPHLMPSLDPEMAAFLHDHLTNSGVTLCLNSAVVGFKPDGEAISVLLASGQTLSTDLVILSVGVRPRTELAVSAGLKIGETGGIWVDDQMRTSDENIWAVGDAVEIRDVVLNLKRLVPLAGPANRQGRIAADNIFGDGSSPHRFRGSQATAVCGVLGLTVASTGVSEKYLKQISEKNPISAYEKIYLHPDHHAGYYPDAKTITMKLIFSKTDGRVLGAQAIGLAGVEKRIDVIAMAIQKSATVYDLEEAELCYAPQFGSAKDPVNLAGMIAANVLRGHVSVGHWQDLQNSEGFILDVRTPREYRKGHLTNAVNVPLDVLRSRLGELPQDREIWTHCFVGQRSYYAARILQQHGFRVRNLSGGFLLYPAVERFKNLLKPGL